MVRQAWKNSVIDCTARSDIFFPSDHFILQAEIRVKLRSTTTINKNTVPKFFKPNEEEYRLYNKDVHDWFTENAMHDIIDDNYDKFMDTLDEAATKQLLKKSPEMKSHYLSRGTW
jgi:hypothetical protein